MPATDFFENWYNLYFESCIAAPLPSFVFKNFFFDRKTQHKKKCHQKVLLSSSNVHNSTFFFFLKNTAFTHAFAFFSVLSRCLIGMVELAKRCCWKKKNRGKKNHIKTTDFFTLVDYTYRLFLFSWRVRPIWEIKGAEWPLIILQFFIYSCFMRKKNTIIRAARKWTWRM